MAKFGDGGELLKCSFCGKSQKQVKKLIAGPGVYICDECIDLCNEIIEEELNEGAEVTLDDEIALYRRRAEMALREERWNDALVFLAKIDAGLAELDEGLGLPHEEVRQRLGL